MRLIERSLALELAGEVHIAYEPSGVVCDVVCPYPSRGKMGSRLPEDTVSQRILR